MPHTRLIVYFPSLPQSIVAASVLYSCPPSHGNFPYSGFSLSRTVPHMPFRPVSGSLTRVQTCMYSDFCISSSSEVNGAVRNFFFNAAPTDSAPVRFCRSSARFALKSPQCHVWNYVQSAQISCLLLSAHLAVASSLHAPSRLRHAYIGGVLSVEKACLRPGLGSPSRSSIFSMLYVGHVLFLPVVICALVCSTLSRPRIAATLYEIKDSMYGSIEAFSHRVPLVLPFMT
jgi:hypothetical protein